MPLTFKTSLSKEIKEKIRLNHKELLKSLILLDKNKNNKSYF